MLDNAISRAAGVHPVEAARGAAMLGTRPSFPPRRKPSPTVQQLRSLCTKCWDADPGKRPSFEEVVAELEAMLEALPKHSHFNQATQGAACCGVQ